MASTFEQLDFVYMPSRDVAADLAYFTDVLGGRLIFAVEGMGTRVAMVELTQGPPQILLADHLEGDRPVLVYRVADLTGALDDPRGAWLAAPAQLRDRARAVLLVRGAGRAADPRLPAIAPRGSRAFRRAPRLLVRAAPAVRGAACTLARADVLRLLGNAPKRGHITATPRSLLSTAYGEIGLAEVAREGVFLFCTHQLPTRTRS